MAAIRGSKTFLRPEGAEYICYTRTQIRDDGSYFREVLAELLLPADVFAVRLAHPQPKKPARKDASTNIHQEATVVNAPTAEGVEQLGLQLMPNARQSSPSPALELSFEEHTALREAAAHSARSPSKFDTERAVNLLCVATENLNTIQQELLSKAALKFARGAQVDCQGRQLLEGSSIEADTISQSALRVGIPRISGEYVEQSHSRADPSVNSTASFSGNDTNRVQHQARASIKPIPACGSHHPEQLPSQSTPVSAAAKTAQPTLQVGQNYYEGRYPGAQTSAGKMASRHNSEIFCWHCGNKTECQTGPADAVKKCYVNFCSFCGPLHRWRKGSIPYGFRCIHGLSPATHSINLSIRAPLTSSTRPQDTSSTPNSFQASSDLGDMSLTANVHMPKEVIDLVLDVDIKESADSDSGSEDSSFSIPTPTKTVNAHDKGPTRSSKDQTHEVKSMIAASSMRGSVTHNLARHTSAAQAPVHKRSNVATIPQMQRRLVDAMEGDLQTDLQAQKSYPKAHANIDHRSSEEGSNHYRNIDHRPHSMEKKRKAPWKANHSKKRPKIE